MSKVKTILIIDDDAEVRKALQAILTRPSAGTLLSRGADLFDTNSSQASFAELAEPVYNLLLAESGEEALDKVAESLAHGQPVALAFIDMKMPGLNGAETARAIWQLDSRVKAVFVTAYSESTPREIIEVTGRRDHFYLRKPFNGEVIRQFALSLTDQWQLEREREALAGELERKNIELAELNETLEEEVKIRSAMLFQSEKMASIGVLAAGVAHEINNPISFVHSNLETFAGYSSGLKKLLQGYQEMAAVVKAGRLEDANQLVEELREQEAAEKIDFALDDIIEMISESLEGTARISNIIKDLRYISRDNHEIIGSANVNKLLDSVLTLIEHQLDGRIELDRQYSKLPEIVCYPQQLSQVFMHILLNAIKAIKSTGTITITTREIIEGRRRSDNQVVVEFTDNGCGIAEDDLKKVFDPFFTTRDVGTGTGLGMSISHDIVKAHQGIIKITSKIGVGTTLTMQLPVEVRGSV